MAQREAMWRELLLERGAERARLNARGPRDWIHLEHHVERGQIDRNGRAIATRTLDATDDRSPAAEWNRNRPPLHAHLENLFDVTLSLRTRDQIGRSGEVTPESAHEIAIRLAVGVTDAFGRIGAAEWRHDARLGQRDRFDGRRVA